MKLNQIPALPTLAAILFCAPCARAALYSTDFNTDQTAFWTINDPGLSDTDVDFYYDYSSIGVPSAPNGTGTRGMKLTANNSGGVFSGFSVSPTGLALAGNYTVSFDLWQNYVGPLGAGGSGSTQLSIFGVGTTGTTAVWAGSGPAWSNGDAGVGFAVTLDGGSAADFRAYSSAASTSYAGGSSVYLAPDGVINNSNAYYADAFLGQSAPAAQVALYPGQIGTTDAGEIAFTWRRVSIEVAKGFATWSVDGLSIARVDLATVNMNGGNLFFGHSDSNSGSSTDPNAALLNITLVDNITVIPEPSSVALLGLAAMAMASRRRRDACQRLAQR